nr:winged helix-turn-helix domain-containing protein [Halohasta litorea]
MWDVVSALPPSAKLIAKVLEYNGTLTQSALADKSRLSPRTVRHALTEHDEAGVVDSEISLADARQQLYSLKVEP